MNTDSGIDPAPQQTALTLPLTLATQRRNDRTGEPPPAGSGSRSAKGRPLAWLDGGEGVRIPLGKSLSVGRSSACDLKLEDEKVSRWHAQINHQEGDAYWLSDLSSINGTYLNGRRIQRPTMLQGGDEIRVLSHMLTFQSDNARAVRRPSCSEGTTRRTLVEMRQESRWMLLADIESSTELAASMSAADYRSTVDAWFERSWGVVAGGRGDINKFLGDGFLACWLDDGAGASKVAAAIGEFRSMRDELPFWFRLAVHLGNVCVGGLGTANEESLSGPEVNYTFRMERVASACGAGLVLSEGASRALEGRIGLTTLHRCSVPGFGGQHTFYIQ